MDDGLQSVQAAEGEEPNKHHRLTASFGILCNPPYEPDKHTGETVERNPVDGKQYAIAQIDWILKEGQMVPEAGIQARFDGYTVIENFDKPLQLPVVTSDLPSSELPQSLKHDGARRLCYVEFRPDPKAVEGGTSISRLKNNLLYPRRPKAIRFKHNLHFDTSIDPLTGRLSVTPLYLDYTPISGSRTIWLDPANLDDGCSAISIPPPMYCLTRPESTAASLFERIAEQRAQKDNEGKEGEDDIPADESSLGDPDEDVGS